MTFACENGSQTSSIAEKSSRGSQRLRKEKAPPRVVSSTSRRERYSHQIKCPSTRSRAAYHYHPKLFFFFCVLCSLALTGQSIRVPRSNDRHHLSSSSTTTPPPPSSAPDAPTRDWYRNPWIHYQFMAGYKFTPLSRCGAGEGPERRRYPPNRVPGERSSTLSSPLNSGTPTPGHHPQVAPAVDAPSPSACVSPFPGGSTTTTDSVSHSQCLLLNDDLRRTLCPGDRDSSVCSANSSVDLWFERRLDYVHLPFCSHYTLSRVIPLKYKRTMYESRKECEWTLDILKENDANAHKLICEFDSVLARFDCNTDYSLNWNCTQCKAAYRSWVCAMILPFFHEDTPVKSCRSFCHRVEQRCPYFHPFIKEQYAGEPAFKCIDRNIPDLPFLSPKSAHGVEDKCYSPCHLEPDLQDPELDCGSRSKWWTQTDIEEDEKSEKRTEKRADEGGGRSVVTANSWVSKENNPTSSTTPGASRSNSASTSKCTTYLQLRPWMVAICCALLALSRRLYSCRTDISDCGVRSLVTD